MVFYRKYRPQKLADLVGQDVVKDNLLAQLVSGSISHGYLFYGPKGSGKTSSARIFAKAVNCEQYRPDKKGIKPKFGEPCNRCDSCKSITEGRHLDLIEIDAASNRGIDEIRDLREKIKLAPVAGQFKVYIIDEVHMLTTEAFNALLKTLEEPPSHAIFILCTTSLEKVPATIISRLSRFNFKKASLAELSGSIETVAKKEGIKIEKEATLAIAKAADGSYRDAFSILDQLSSLKGTIGEGDVKAAFKLTSTRALYDFLEKVFAFDLAGSIAIVEEISQEVDISNFIREEILILKKILFLKIGIGEIDFDGFDKLKLEELSGKISFKDLQNFMKLLLIAESEIKYYPVGDIALTLAVCKFMPDFGGKALESEEKAGGERVEKDVPKEPEDIKEGTEREDGGKRMQTQAKILKKSLGSAAEIDSHGHSPWSSDAHSALRAVDSSASSPPPKLQFGRGPRLIAIEAKWNDFLIKVKPHNAHVVALLRSARPVGFDNDKLIVEVFFKFHKEKLEEPKIMDLLHGVLGDVTGRPIKMKFVLADRSSKPTKAVKTSDVSEIEDDELSKMAAEIFSK